MASFDRQFTSPCLGEHNEYVYRKFLGHSYVEIAELLVEGIIITEAGLADFRAWF